MKRVALLAVALAVTAALTGPAAFANAPTVHPEAGSGRPAAAKARTTLVFHVRRCNGCQVGVQRGLDPGSVVRPKRPRYWNGPIGTVHRGKVVLTVPTPYTSGMTFTIYAPWQDSITDAATNIVLGYPGTAPGSRVSKRAARHAPQATACWAGTARATVRFHVQVRRVHGRTLGGGRGVTPVAWASPTKPTVPGTATRTILHGIIGNQDAYYC